MQAGRFCCRLPRVSLPTSSLAGGRERLLSGNLLGAVGRLAGPMLASAVLQNAQSLIDLYWVHNLGTDAVAALALSGTLLMLLFPVLMGLSTGTVAMVARAFGGGDDRRAAAVAGQSLTVATLVGVIVGLTCIPLILPATHLLHATPAVAELSRQYMLVSLLGMWSGYALFVANSALQGAGNTVAPMGLMLLANLLNLVLDPLLIFGRGPFPAWGVGGAACATVLSQLTAAAVAIVLLVGRRTRLQVRAGDFVPRLDLVRRLLTVGLPSMGQMTSRSLMGLVFFRIVGAYGSASMAGYGIGMRIHMVLLMPCFVLGNAAATLVGQNLGARQARRAASAAWVAAGVCVLLMALSAAAMVLWAEQTVSQFASGRDVIAVGASYLRIVTPFYVFAGLAIVLDRGMNGAGSTVPTMVFTVLTLWGLQVPLAYLFATIFTPPIHGVWWAICTATLVHAVLSAGWFLRGSWKRKAV